MNTKNTDTAKSDAKTFYNKQMETMNRIKLGKEKIDVLSHELDLLNYTNAIDSQNLREFETVLMTIGYAIDVDDVIKSVDKNLGQWVNPDLVQKLVKKISADAKPKSYDDCLSFFEKFMTEYNKLNEANK